MKKLIIIIFIILFILLGVLTCLFVKLWSKTDEIPSNESKTVKSQEVNIVKNFYEDISQYDSYTSSVTINLISDKKEYSYDIKEEYSPKGLHVFNHKIDEYIRQYDDYYIHYFMINDSKYQEDIRYPELSIIKGLKNKKFTHSKEDDYDVYSSDINLEDTYLYELHDFLRTAVQDSQVKLSGKSNIKMYFSNGDNLEKIRINCLDGAKSTLNNNSIKECKIIIENIEFVNGLTLTLPEKYSSSIEVGDRYKSFDTKKVNKKKEKKKKSKNKKTVDIDDSFNSFVFKGKTLRLGESTVQDILDTESSLEYDTSDNQYYAVYNDGDYIKFSVYNPYQTEVSINDCVIYNVYYENNGYNDISSLGNISIGDNINNIISILGNSYTLDNNWYTWSNGDKSISVYSLNGEISAINF